MKSDMQKVKNPRCFKMMERLLPYSFEVEYKEGKKMAVADYGSRAPISEGNHREYRITNNDIGIKIKSNRVRRLNIKDHSLTKLAKLAKQDVNYQRMIQHLKQGSSLNQIEEDCELRLLRGDIQHIGLFNTEEGPLIVRDSSNVLIPQEARKGILQELHSTHLSIEYMKPLSRGRFFWPNILEDIKKTFSECKDCRRESSSKSSKTYNTTPPNLVLMAPGEEISCDYMSFGANQSLSSRTGSLAP